MARTPTMAFGLLLACAASGLPGPAGAAPRETGFHTMHPSVRVGGRLCFADHFHEGDSSAAGSRRIAEGAAIRRWVQLTVEEYGTAWGSYATAVGKKMTCNQSGGLWSCNVIARPCRSAR